MPAQLFQLLVCCYKVLKQSQAIFDGLAKPKATLLISVNSIILNFLILLMLRS